MAANTDERKRLRSEIAFLLYTTGLLHYGILNGRCLLGIDTSIDQLVVPFARHVAAHGPGPAALPQPLPPVVDPLADDADFEILPPMFLLPADVSAVCDMAVWDDQASCNSYVAESSDHIDSSGATVSNDDDAGADAIATSPPPSPLPAVSWESLTRRYGIAEHGMYLHLRLAEDAPGNRFGRI